MSQTVYRADYNSVLLIEIAGGGDMCRVARCCYVTEEIDQDLGGENIQLIDTSFIFAL